MPLEYDPVTTLRHWPIPMGKYGKTPFGDNLYRIVFTESRLHLIRTSAAGEVAAYRWLPRYAQVQSPWVLEKWTMPTVSRFQWESDMSMVASGAPLVPYPSRGEYEMLWEFDQGVDADSLDN